MRDAHLENRVEALDEGFERLSRQVLDVTRSQAQLVRAIAAAAEAMQRGDERLRVVEEPPSSRMRVDATTTLVRVRLNAHYWFCGRFSDEDELKHGYLIDERDGHRIDVAI
jgi:hypothetical protein